MAYDFTDVVHDLQPFTYGDNEWLSGVDKAVLLNIAHHANKDTLLARPGFTLIANETFFSRRAVMRSIGVLEKLGFISIGDERSKRRTNMYTLNLEAISEIVDAQLGGKTEKKPKRKGNFAKAKKEAYVYKDVPVKQWTVADDDITFNEDGDEMI